MRSLRIALLSASLAGLAWPAATAGADRPAPGTPASVLPPALQEIGLDQRLGQKVPLDAVFRDETGREVRLGDYFGRRPVILTLVYYECPMLCTLVLNGLISSLDVLTLDPSKDFEIVSVSINPKEKPDLAAAKKKEYLGRYKRPSAAEGWHFLTGEEKEIQRLAAAVGFRYRFDADSNLFAHPSGIMVLTPEGKLSRYFYGVEYAPRDLRFALVEASEHRIGNIADQVLLYCYQYDPKSAKYAPAVLSLVRAGGVATVLVLGAGFLTMRLRERRRARVRTA